MRIFGFEILSPRHSDRVWGLIEIAQDARHTAQTACGAIESNQVTDKDVRGMLRDLVQRIDEKLKP